MTKHEFLNEVKKNLSQLSPEEPEKQLAFYSEMIDDRLEDGMSEEEAVAAMGAPEEAARTALEALPLGTLVKTRVRPSGGWSPTAVILAVLGSPLWLPIVLVLLSCGLVVYVLVWVCVAVFFAVILAILAASVGLLFFTVLGFGPVAVSTLALMAGCAIAGLGLAILALPAFVWLVKKCGQLTVRLLRGLKSALIRREK